MIPSSLGLHPTRFFGLAAMAMLIFFLTLDSTKAAVGGPWRKGELLVENAWALLQTVGGDKIRIFLQIHNLSDRDDVILAVMSPSVRTFYFHVVEQQPDKTPTDQPVFALNLEQHREIEMSINGTHIVLEGLDKTVRPGGVLPVTIVTINEDKLELSVPILAGKGGLRETIHRGH